MFKIFYNTTHGDGDKTGDIYLKLVRKILKNSKNSG